MSEDAGITLTSVATRLLGASGRAMLDALVAGTTDADVLADLARGTLRKKLPALRQALAGRFLTASPAPTLVGVDREPALDIALEQVKPPGQIAIPQLAR